MTTLLIYGAAGFTGKLICAQARKHLEVLAAGRRAPPGAFEDFLPLELMDAGALRAALSRVPAVLNCAGPFAHTWEPLVEACLDTGTHYLDLCAEWAVFEAMRRRDAAARERGVLLLPGVGFDVVATDCLAAHVAARLPGAQRLEIGISGLELVSRGSARTIFELAGEPVRVRRGGEIVPEAQLREAHFDFGAGPRPAYGVSWADVSSAHHTTGIPDIAVFFEATPAVAALALANRSFGWLARTKLLGGLARAQLALLPPGPLPQQRAARRAVVVARATDEKGRSVSARLTTPEAYSFSAASAVAAVRSVMRDNPPPGFQTPGSLFGADFVLGLEGVERTEIPS